MCGICGITSNTVSKERRQGWVRRMNAAIHHRGPDGEGYYDDSSASLAMVRLAIIDVKGGDQPIFNEDGRLAVFFNGEIYNYRDLKEKLQQRGHTFNTYSDTEVLVHLYEDFGVEMVSHLRGMFAFCIYDTVEKTCFLARDAFGEKPLYYHLSKDGTFSFASELTALLVNEAIPRYVDQEALGYYLSTGYIPEPHTLLDGVYSLSPGHYLCWEKGCVRSAKWFVHSYDQKEVIDDLSTAKKLVTEKLEESVRRQMVSEVPVGAFLSGGIDSSAIVALMQRSSSKPVKTFTARFSDQSYDESKAAARTAKYLGTDHHELNIPKANFSETLFWELMEHTGMPFPDSSSIPTFLLCKEMRKHVTVALSGDGGDELFAGYDIFPWWRQIGMVENAPDFLKKSGLQVLESIQEANLIAGSSRLRQVIRGVRVASEKRQDQGRVLHELFSDTEKFTLTEGRLGIGKVNSLNTFPAEWSGWSALRRAMYYRMVHNLPSDMLIKVDRMSMANSLEVRAPFLDIDLYQTSNKLPDRFLLNGKTTKHILREIVKDLVPLGIHQQPKSGFALPLHEYQNATFSKLAKDLISPDNDLYHFFNEVKLKEIVYNGLNLKRDNSKISVYQATHQLWALMQLFGWARRFNVSFANS